MADIAKLEAEALTALRQYQEAITRELQQLLSVATNDPANAGKKHIVERLSNEGKEAANLYWNWHRAYMAQLANSVAIAKELLQK